MATALKDQGKGLVLDEDGFLLDIGSWNISVAEKLARTEGIENMTSDHWKVITAIRLYYERNGVSPLCRDLAKETGYTKKEIYALFPSGHLRGAYKLAGLPKPAGCN